MRSLFRFLLFLFFSSNVSAYDVPNILNSRLLDEVEKDRWELIDNVNYIPFLNFKDIEFKNMNSVTPNISVYLDTSKDQYKEHYYFIIDNFIAQLQLTRFKKGKSLSKEDKYKDVEESIHWAVLPNTNLQIMTQMSIKYPGLNVQNMPIDHFHNSKFIITNQDEDKNKYCVSFYFWTEIDKVNQYHTLVNNLWCNTKIQQGENIFTSYKEIEKFVKNIEYDNRTRLSKLYEDEKTRLIRLKAEEEKKQEEIKKKQKASAMELANLNALIAKIESKISEIKRAIENVLVGISREFQRIEEFVNKFNPDKTYSINFDGIVEKYLGEKKLIEALINDVKVLIKSLPKDYDSSSFNDKIKVLLIELTDFHLAINSTVASIKVAQSKLDKQAKKFRLEKIKQQKEKDAKEKKRMDTIVHSGKMLSKQEQSFQSLDTLITQIVRKIEFIESNNFAVEILKGQEMERKKFEDTFISTVNEFNEDYNQIKEYGKKFDIVEMLDIEQAFVNLNEKIQAIKTVFDEKNITLKNIIIQQTLIADEKRLEENRRQNEIREAQEAKDRLLYVLFGTIVVLLLVLITVFMYFIRSNKRNVNFDNKQTKNNIALKKDSSFGNDKPKKLPEEKVDGNTITEKINENIDDNNQSLPKKEIKPLIKENIVEEAATPPAQKTGSDDLILKDYLDIFTNPKNLNLFKDKWNVQAMERVSPLSQKEEIYLETSKKILERANFWLIRDKEDVSLYYILPGRILWSRIQEIMSDNSRFGFMNFNGIYAIKETKKHEITTLATATKDENGKINVISQGEISILKII